MTAPVAATHRTRHPIWLFALVALGGSLGTAARYSLQTYFPMPDGAFPLATFAINVVGALMLGVLFPEVASIPLSEDEAGELVAEPAATLWKELDRTDSAVVGPGMIDRGAAGQLVSRIAAEPREKVALVLDAAACSAAVCSAFDHASDSAAFDRCCRSVALPLAVRTSRSAMAAAAAGECGR